MGKQIMFMGSKPSEAKVKWWRQKPTTDSHDDHRRDEHGCEPEILERTKLMTIDGFYESILMTTSHTTVVTVYCMCCRVVCSN